MGNAGLMEFFILNMADVTQCNFNFKCIIALSNKSG